MLGVTLHYIDPGIDSGAIVTQKHVPNDPDQSARQLYDSCVETGIDLVDDWIFKCGTGHPPGSLPQNEVDATYKDGVLALTIPKAEQARPRAIDIKVG